MIWLATALAAGALVYCGLALYAALHYRKTARIRPTADLPPISILKPLKGADLGLEDNLRSFFEQAYTGEFEIVFALEFASDPAVGVVEKLQAQYPGIPARILIVGETPWTNAKVWSLHHMVEAARHDLLVMADSDIRVGPDLLTTLAQEFLADPRLGLATCPYRAKGGPSLWSELEALGMNTEFLAGVLVARLLEGMAFTLGPTVAARKQAIAAVGGWEAFRAFLAEDFVLGQRVTAAGWNSILSAYVVEHRIGSETLRKNFAHRLRWNRSTRRSRPAGYVGQIFTNPLPLVLFAWYLWGLTWPYLALGVSLRYGLGWVTACWILGQKWGIRELLLLPVQDTLSLAFWALGFWGNQIEWRGRVFMLEKDGRLKPI
ncbi:MAG: bacteriohopanetetrol glucosamine biosynthesis glycosyltransferase HpnI [Bryobacter sp.]|nr:bacteriohopanetetrol glucosamine biosynthesis glycosyltransferase HpnI [Bryobacter sp.]